MKRATLAILIRDGNVLLGEKKSGAEIGSGTLNGPGGKCEPGESAVDCVVREVREEVGITLDTIHLSEIATITFYAAGFADFEVVVFRTEHFEGEPIETEEMIPGWYSVANLPFHRMLESDRSWFRRAIQGEPFKAAVYYKERAAGFERIEFLT